MSFNEWSTVRLEELCSEITDGSHSSPKTVQDGYPMASVKDMEYSSINIDTCRKISYEDYEKLVKGKCKPLLNDVLIAKDGSYMKHVNVVKEEQDIVLLSSIAILRPILNKLYPDFLKYYLLNPIIKNDLEQGYVSGSVIRRIVLKDFKRFPITLPPIEEQKAIAKILSDLDDKIEVNNKINKRLEEMAQSIFKHWFVDFEFPNEDGQPYKSSGGEMVESELGMIPKGWEVKQVKDFGNVITGKTPSTKKEEYYGDKYPFITIPDMHNSMYINKTERYLSEEGNQVQVKKLIPENSLIVSCIATVGLVSINSVESHTNQQINSIIPNSKELLPYLFFDIKSKGEYLNLLGSSGTTTKNVNKTIFENIKVIYPNEKILQQFYNVVLPKFETIKNRIYENEKLANLRDTLLPKLMSGEIRVPLD